MRRNQMVSARRRRLGFEAFESRRLMAALIGADLSQPESDPMGMWSRVDKSNPSFGPTSTIASPATNYMLHSLDLGVLKQHLNQAPSENLLDQQSWSTISLPAPDGGFENFEYVVSSIMDPELAAQFPEIQTYAGRSLSDPSATIRFDLTPAGFHAQILSPRGAYYIDPYGSAGADGVYATYLKADALRAASFVELAAEELHVDESTTDDSLAESKTLAKQTAGKPVPIASRSGTQLRTYRAAVAATGEYTAFHGGTVALGQAAIVTAMNRVNQIYENELSIRMVLVANNNLLVYTNPATDPYTNNDGELMLTENQNNIDALIGNANYDIGHVFSTGGGGIAALGSVGINSSKAEGVTGSGAPVNDAFWVDYVAHEIGHQFGGDHTFNSETGSCGGGNRSPSTAMEPGSGSTIQAYAGICGSDNLQPNSDPYFHSISFDEMINHVDNVIPGVGTRTATGNSVPTINAGVDYTIPANTPFVLTATGNDANGSNVLTYNWEQRNVGPAQTLAQGDNGSSPLFRSFLPTTNPSRTFPRLSNLVNNTLPVGEKLPTTTRTLNFRATVRDNSTGGGGVNTDDAVVNVVNTGAAFAVTSPNTAVTWGGLTTQTVTWNVAGTTANGINTANVNILLSTDGGLTYPTTILLNVPNDGSQDITVPNQATTQARIRVQGAGNVFFDISNVNFTITANSSGVDFGDAPDAPYGTLLAGNGARHSVSGPFLGSAIDIEADGQPSLNAQGDGADEDGVTFTNPLIVGTTVSFNVRSSVGGGVLNYFFDFDGVGGFGNQANEVFSTNLTGGLQTISVVIPGSSVLSTYARFRISTAGGLGPTGTAPTGEVEDYQVSLFATAPPLDFGDVPDALGGTLVASNGPRHIATGPRLGALVDSESNGQPNATSTGDGGDEDGILFRSRLIPGTSVPISVTSTGGILNYFFDFDGNGTFGNVAHEVFTANLAAGTQTLSIAVPAGAVLGTSRARFRISTAGGLSATGFAPDGEVEDYQILIVSPVVESIYESFDAAVPPALPGGWTQTNTTANTWSTVAGGSFSGANHAFVVNVGAVSESSLVTPSIAITNANRQLRFHQNYNTESTYDGGVLEVSIGTGAFQDIFTAGGVPSAGGYNATIDSGFGNPLAGRSAWSGNSSGYIETVVDLPVSMVGQNVRFRWRFGTDSSEAAVGWRIDNVRLAGTGFDFGDAPDPTYPTLSANQGASHAQLGSLILGSTRDTEANGQPNSTATGDGADEDGVTIPGTINGNASASFSITASAGGILNAWIDFNGNGSLNDAGEQIAKDIAVATGSNLLVVSVPNVPLTINSFARFRLSTQSALAVDGTAPDGEVEDYALTLSSAAASSVVGRSLFYNRALSTVFGDGTGNPTGSIDSTKQALLPGQTAAFANVSNYLFGLNGLLVDVQGLTTATASDFAFATGNGTDPFVASSAVPTITVLPGVGASGSNRVKIEFADNAIRNTWLRVTLLANANTGLAANDVFYFGSAVGEMNIGNVVGPPVTLRTNANDTGFVRQNQSPNPNTVLVTNVFDINKDGRVNATDTGFVRQNQSPTGSIVLFTAPASLSLARVEPTSRYSLSSIEVDDYFTELGRTRRRRAI